MESKTNPTQQSFEAALEAYKGDIREAYNFGYDEETNAVNLAVKAARWARQHALNSEPVTQLVAVAKTAHDHHNNPPVFYANCDACLALAAFEKAKGGG